MNRFRLLDGQLGRVAVFIRSRKVANKKGRSFAH
nr:MAG TPA: hypothetical protein [Caudoviricetes sp.]